MVRDVPDTDSLSAADVLGITGICISTVLIALGLDLGFTLTTLLAAHGYEDTLQVRAILVITGAVVFAAILYLTDESSTPE